MNKEQAKIEYEKIIHDANKEIISAMEEAKRNGTWKPGLDTNEALFSGIKEEAKKKIEVLKTLID